METLLITNGYIVIPNQILIDGAIYVEGNIIKDIGKSEDLIKKHCADTTINANKMLVLPGLINSHIHASATLYRGIGDDMTLMEENKRVMFPIELKMTDEDSYWGTMLACIELIKSGTTCMADHYINMKASAEAVYHTGMRAVLATAMMDQWDQSETAPIKSTEECIRENEELIKKWNKTKTDRIRCNFGPYTELLASKELLLMSRDLAEDYNVGIQIHLAETLEAQEKIRRKHGGLRIFEYLKKIRFLGPRVIAAHCVWLSTKEIDIIKTKNVKPVHMPAAEMKLSDGISPVPTLLQNGIPVALGTDGGGWNNCNDMIREMKHAALLHKVNTPLDPAIMPAEHVFQMATINGARALQMENEIGSLEIGKKADIILIDIKKPHWTPILSKPKINLINHLVYTGMGSDVDTVIIDGKIIMRERKILEINSRIGPINEGTIMIKAQEISERLIEESGVSKEKIPWRWDTTLQSEIKSTPKEQKKFSDF